MSTSANTVTVACKLPAGIYMQGYVMKGSQEAVPGGFRDIQVAVPVGPAVKINGVAAPQGSVAPGLVQGGYVLTHNVPADTANAWMEANKDSAMVKNKLVFIANRPEAAAAKAKSLDKQRSGLERLDVGTKSEQGRTVPADPRWPRANNRNVTGIMTAER